MSSPFRSLPYIPFPPSSRSWKAHLPEVFSKLLSRRRGRRRHVEAREGEEEEEEETMPRRRSVRTLGKRLFLPLEKEQKVDALVVMVI